MVSTHQLHYPITLGLLPSQSEFCVTMLFKVSPQAASRIIAQRFFHTQSTLPKKKRWRPAWLHETFMISCNIGNFPVNGSFQSRSVHGG